MAVLCSLNENMIETLFSSNCINAVQKEATGKPTALPSMQEKRVLDPKKSQNIAILLRALNVTREEVTEALLDGKSIHASSEYETWSLIKILLWNQNCG